MKTTTPSESIQVISAYPMGWAAAVARFAARIGLIDGLNDVLEWDPAQCHLSPGVRLMALMVAFLIDPCALYRMEEFYQPFDCAVLFGAGVQATDFTDDALGRALLKLHAAHPAQIFADLSARAIAAFDLPNTEEVHADTTSLTLQGDYAAADAAAEASADTTPPETARPMRGYNKDGQRDCKQLVLGAVTRPDGIPVRVDVNDGNLDDTVWNRQALASLKDALTARPDILFVADSKLIADKTVDHLCQEDIHFVSRMPNTYGLTATTKDAAAEHSTWTEEGAIARRQGAARYRIGETSGVVATHPVRLVVVESSALRAKADASIAQDQETAATRVDNAAQRLGRQRFASEAEAQQALESWKKALPALDWWSVEAVLNTATRRRRRPGGGSLVTVTEWFWTVQRGALHQTFVDREHLRRRTFVLISNDPQRSAAELLAAYNGEWVVEGTHATLKGPLSIAPVFLKDPRKLTASVYVVYLAVLLWSVMQAVARRNALKWQVSLPYPNGKLQDAPSTKRIKELLTPVTIVCYHVGTTTHRVLKELTWVQRLACLLLEIEPRRLAAVPSG
jgi:transposase